MARGRFREALDVLNEAIRLDPRYAESFDNRAAVFERLGMYPQADADRRKVVSLGGVRRPAPPPPGERRGGFDRRGGPRGSVPHPPPAPPPAVEPEPDVVADVIESAPPPAEPEPEPESTVVASTPITDEPAVEEQGIDESPVSEVTDEPVGPSHGRRRVVGPRYPAPPPSGGGGGTAALRSFGTLFIMMGLLTAAGIGIYLALTSIGDALDGDDGFAPGGVVTPTPSVSAGESGTPTPPPEDVDEALAGDPLSYSSFDAAWQAKGITAEPSGAADGFRGFGTTPVSVTLTRGSETMEVVLLFYGSPAGPAGDFDLSPSAITPKQGRVAPSGATGWYNANVVAVIPDRDVGLYADARDAFFGVSA
jgi:hypothetical protein